MGSDRLVVHLYTICWNEEHHLPFFFRHYDPVVDRYVVYDDGSTDGSLELLRAHDRVEVRPFGDRPDGSFIRRAQEIHGESWKESRGDADWVIISAVDELFVHRSLAEYLARMHEQGVTAVPALGYQMVSPSFPPPRGSLTDHVPSGAPWVKMNKLIAFRPDRITDTHFTAGRHEAAPTGEVRYPDRDECLNLHFKYLGFEETFARHRELLDKIGSHDRSRNWGHRYAWDRDQLRADWDTFESAAVPDVLAGIGHAHESHPAPRWWRPDVEVGQRPGPRWMFICGCARSGTTTTTDLLRAHPTVALGRERYNSLFKRESGAFAPSLFQHRRFLQDLRDGDSHHGALDQYYAELRHRWPQRTHVGDKIPSLHRAYEDVAERFSGARFVFLVRDVIEVAQSWLNRQANEIAAGAAVSSTRGLDEALSDWNEPLHNTIAAIRRGVPIFVLPYERLYVDDEVLVELTNFLELDPSEELWDQWRVLGARRGRLDG